MTLVALMIGTGVTSGDRGYTVRMQVLGTWLNAGKTTHNSSPRVFFVSFAASSFRCIT